MPRPAEWKGSDLRARSEVVQWLHDHGDEVHDPSGLIVGRMRTDLGRGRALSQLLFDMESDGMIRREIKGRRTLSIKLLDDWDLLNDLRQRPVSQLPPAMAFDGDKSDTTEMPTISGDVDYEQLAAVLLALVLRRAQAQPSQGAAAEKLREEAAQLRRERQELRDNLIMARESEAEQRRQADSMRDSLAKLQQQIDKPRRGQASIAERLSDSEQRMLRKLMEELPSGK